VTLLIVGLVSVIVSLQLLAYGTLNTVDFNNNNNNNNNTAMESQRALLTSAKCDIRLGIMQLLSRPARISRQENTWQSKY